MVIPSLSNQKNASDDSWIVFDYELQMYFETRNLLKHLRTQNNNDIKNIIIKNATVESMLLHTRIMTDILISKGKSKDNDDITLKGLLPNWCESGIGEKLIKELKNAYGNQNDINSPCWIINKMLAHPTKWRSDNFDYSVYLKQIEPAIHNLLSEIEKVIQRPILTYYVVSMKR